MRESRRTRPRRRQGAQRRSSRQRPASQRWRRTGRSLTAGRPARSPAGIVRSRRLRRDRWRRRTASRPDPATPYSPSKPKRVSAEGHGQSGGCENHIKGRIARRCWLSSSGGRRGRRRGGTFLAIAPRKVFQGRLNHRDSISALVDIVKCHVAIGHTNHIRLSRCTCDPAHPSKRRHLYSVSVERPHCRGQRNGCGRFDEATCTKQQVQRMRR